MTTIDLNDLSKEVRKNNEANGFTLTDKPFTYSQWCIPALILQWHTLLSEILHAHQKGEENRFLEQLDRFDKQCRQFKNEALSIYNIVPEVKDMRTAMVLMHDELSEAFKAWSNNDLAKVTEEFADVFIRILDTCGKYGLKIQDAMLDKISKNKTRGYRHGDKRY